MTGIQLPGLATGLNTQDLISQLMTVEAQPQVLLKAKVATQNTRLTDFQALNTKIAALIDAAKTAASTTALHSFKVTSTDQSVTATAKNTAIAGSIDLTVTKLASSQQSVTGVMSAWPQDPPTLTFVKPDGTKTEVTASSTNLDDIVSAVNKSDSGVLATKVAAGKDASGNPQYRLQFTSKESGADNAFQVYSGSAADVDAGTATDLMTQAGSATIRTASDAEAKLFAGTAAEQTITSSSNTFTDLLPGVDVTVSQLTSSPVTIGIAQDTSAAGQTVSSFVSSLTAIFSLIATGSTSQTVTNADGTKTLTPGSYTGDSAIRDAQDQLIRAVTDPINDRSLSDIGINLTKDGTVTFDIEAFKSALAADPTKVESMFSTMAGRVQQAATNLADPYDGTFTAKIKNTQSEVNTLNDQISDWDTRLAARKAALTTQYASLETIIGQMNSQMTYLTSQIAGLPTYNNSSKS